MNSRLPHSSVKLLSVSLLLSGLLVAGGVWLGQQALAQTETPSTEGVSNDVNLTAIPPRMGEDNTLKLKPGEKKQVSLRVKNTSDSTLTVRTQAQDFIIDEDGETPIPITEDVSNRWSLASWLTLTPNLQTLSSNQTGAVNVLIQVPEDALPGGHYAMILHQPDQGRTPGEGTEGVPASDTGVTQRVGTLLYVIVDGPINEEAFVRDFVFPEFTEFGPVPYSFTVENGSDIHVRPQIGIEIYNMLGRRVDVIQPETKNIFPLSSRDYEGTWGRIWGWGLYTAKLTMSFGTGGQVVIAKTSFWLLPLKLIMTVVVLLLALIAAGIATRRHMIHRRGDESKRVKMLEEKVRQLETTKLKDFED